MSKRQFINLLNTRIRENALEYLLHKQKSKGKDIPYTNIQMAEYLMPGANISISQKQKMFAVKNRMIEISENFPGRIKKEICVCCQKDP